MSAANAIVRRLAVGLLLAATLAGCAARPTPICTGAYRPFDSRQMCRPPS